MADAAHSIAGLIPVGMSAGLLASNIDYIKSKKKKKSLLGLGVGNIVGMSMIQATAEYTDW